MNPTSCTRPPHLLHWSSPRRCAPETAPTYRAPPFPAAWRRQLRAPALAGVPCSPPSAAGLPGLSPAPATASSAPIPQSGAANACAAAVSTPLSDPEIRWRSAAVQYFFANRAWREPAAGKVTMTVSTPALKSTGAAASRSS